jgi:hypothetical protein
VTSSPKFSLSPDQINFVREMNAKSARILAFPAGRIMRGYTCDAAPVKTPHEHILDYIERGWRVNPIPFKEKGPKIKKWQSLEIDAANVKKHFPPDQPMNIGVQLGTRSNNLLDVDLDCIEALIIASYFFPRTDAMFGRPSKRNSHRLYYCDIAETSDAAGEQFKDPRSKEEIAALLNAGGSAMLIELRIGGGKAGAQTVFPGSIHKTGEVLAWEDGFNGEPTAVTGEVLRKAASGSIQSD